MANRDDAPEQVEIRVEVRVLRDGKRVGHIGRVAERYRGHLQAGDRQTMARAALDSVPVRSLLIQLGGSGNA